MKPIWELLKKERPSALSQGVPNSCAPISLPPIQSAPRVPKSQKINVSPDWLKTWIQFAARPTSLRFEWNDFSADVGEIGREIRPGTCIAGKALGKLKPAWGLAGHPFVVVNVQNAGVRGM